MNTPCIRGEALITAGARLVKRREQADGRGCEVSMLTFYINRAGKNLPQKDRSRLEAAKDALRDLYGKTRKAA